MDEAPSSATRVVDAGDASSPETSSGRRFGRYESRGMLGRGALGAVYEAWDPLLRRVVAVKVMETDDAVDAGHLLAEARAMARLTSPHALAVHDVGTTAEGVYFAMDRVAGLTLREWLAAGVRDPDEIVTMFEQAGRGLCDAHAAGLVHGDFKPDNVMVWSDGRVQVSDFGLARAVGRPRGGADTGPMPLLGGSPAYLAPELWEGEMSTPASDQFALAASLWEALFHELPYGGDAPAAIAWAVTHGELRPVPASSGVHPGVVRVLRRSLSRAPSARYAAVAAMLEDLGRAWRVARAHAPMGGLRYTDIRSVSEPGLRSGAFRALDRLSGREVVLVPLEDDAAPVSETARREWLAGLFARVLLRHPGLLPVSDAGTDLQGRPFAAIELPRDGATFRTAGDAPVETQLGWIAAAFEALGALHTRGYVHGHLSPESVRLVEGRVRLLDAPFTGAVPHGGAGTSAAQDVLDLAAVVRACVAPTPESLDGGLADPSGVPESVRAWLRAPWCSTPDMPCNDASAARGQFGEADVSGLGPESVSSRDSRLREGPTVGREALRKRLAERVLRGARNHGSVALLAGEGGVGKSRLLHEARVAALASGALVVAGSAAVERRAPFHVWRDPLHALALAADPSDAELAALEIAVPGLAQQLGRPRGAARDGARRTDDVVILLCETIVALADRAQRPVFVTLEDLHLAGLESVALLDQLATEVAARALVVLGTFRPEEARHLRDPRPCIDVEPVARLVPSDCETLARALLGPLSGTDARPSRIARESEGNPFFVIECVRAAEEAAARRAGASEPPDVGAAVVVHAMDRMLRRRLTPLADDVRQLLARAAVAGRTLDLPVLEVLAPPARVERALREGAARAIIERRGDAWCFTHDRLREFLCAELGPEGIRESHASLARAIGAVHPEGARDHAALALHWAGAGDRRNEVASALAAARVAMSAGATAEAVAFLDRCLPRNGESADDLGVDLAAVFELRAACASSLGEQSLAIESAERGLRLLGEGLPATAVGRVARFVRELVVHRRMQRIARGPPSGDRHAALVWRLFSWRAIHALLDADGPMAVLASIASVNAATRAGEVSAVCSMYLGFFANLAGFHRYGERMIGLGRAASRDTPARVTDLIHLLASDDGPGFLTTSTRYIHEAEATGAYNAAAWYRCYEAIGRWALGDRRGVLDVVRAAGTHGIDLGHVGNVARVQCEPLALCVLGRREEALESVERLRVLARAASGSGRAAAEGACAWVFAELGVLDKACEVATEARALLPPARQVPPSAAIAIVGALHAWLSVYERNRNGAMGRAARREVHRLLRDTRAMASVLPITRLEHLLAEGRCAWIEGRRDAAVRAWTRVVEEVSDRDARPFFVAEALEHLAGVPALAGERDRWRDEARALYVRSGAPARAARVGVVTSRSVGA